MHYAASCDQLAALQRLLEFKEVDVNALSKEKSTPLYIASINGNLNAVKVLLESDKVRLGQNTVGAAPPLFVAAQEGYIDIVKALLDSKADPNRLRPRVC